MACVPPQELVGYGTLLQYYDTIAAAWVTVGGTKDLETPEDDTESVDTTANDSTGNYGTTIPSPLSRLGEVAYTMNFRWGQWKSLLNMKGNKATYDWRLVLMNPQQTYMQYCAWIKTMKLNIPMEELVEAELTLAPSGTPTWGQLI